MKVRLKVLLDEPRGAAWPPSARAVGVQLSLVTSETYVYSCQQVLQDDWAHCRDCLGNEEEGVGYGRSVWPESSGLHARNNGRDNGMQLRKEKLNL